METDPHVLIRRWRKDWLFSLFVLSHIDFQQKMWVDAAFPNHIGSYAEDMCRYFDDLSLNDNYKFQIKNGYVAEYEFFSIKSFHDMLRCYDENDKIDFEIINDSAWRELVKIGFVCWNDLKNLINDSEEIDFIHQIEQINSIV